MMNLNTLSLLFIVAAAMPPSVMAFSPALYTSYHHQHTASQQSATSTTRTPKSAAYFSQLFHNINNNSDDDNDNTINGSNSKRQKIQNVCKRIIQRLDTIETSGIQDVQMSGLFGRVKKLHNPKTYLIIAAIAGLRYEWCFRNIFYWFGVGFCIKWYRARYVFKIPVWDRQPNWNNVITSKEQEKDLKAYTCKKCGSTIFIAKTREFFFEGSTGIGGLGCFTCGAKGADNFVMDRDRIVEDVADMDDYFEYERPLDFVSAAERRKILKEAKGDEEKANQILLEKANAEAGATEEETTGTPTGIDEANVVDVEVEPPKHDDDDNKNNEGDINGSGTVEAKKGEDESAKQENTEPKSEKKKEKVEDKPKKSSKKPETKKETSVDDEDLDVLGLDDF